MFWLRSFSLISSIQLSRLRLLVTCEWRSVLDAHFSMARSQIRRFRGREVKTLGDGILATFDRPARAVRCAQAIANSVKPLGIAIRAGLHTGEIEIRDDHDVGGIAVNIASRVSNLAGSSEVLVSSIVKDLVAGSGLIFNDLGPHAIKGLEEERAASTSSLTADFGCCPVMFRSTTTPKGVVVQISSPSVECSTCSTSWWRNGANLEQNRKRVWPQLVGCNFSSCDYSAPTAC